MLSNEPADITKQSPDDETIYNVSELNRMVQNLLEDSFLPIWVEGEISNFACPRSGHWYFSLKDKHAQVRCVLFQGRHRYNEALTDGAHVLARAKISFYAVRGEFQLLIEQLEPAGEGALRKAFEQLKAQLAAEGLFDTRHKKPLPKFPKVIGIITSENGAALRDICSILKKRFASIAIIVYPCLVQGKMAAGQIVRQLNCANQRQECDLIILARGGGSLEDLWPFNEEKVARAIFESCLPIISAIGHETDVTIADLVADCRAATPSMAAQLASPEKREYEDLLNKTVRHLSKLMHDQLSLYQQRLENLGKRLRHPRQRLHDNMQRLDDLTLRLNLSMKTQLQTHRQTLSGLSRTLHAVSPLSSLARGYAILTHIKTQQIIRGSEEIRIGDKLIAKIASGKLLCVVEEKLLD